MGGCALRQRMSIEFLRSRAERSLPQQRVKDLRVDRLREKLVASGLERERPVLARRKRGDRDESRVLERLFVAKLARDLAAVEIGQAKVEEHDVGTELSRDGEGGEAVDGELHLVAHHLHEDGHGMHRVEVVLDDEHPPPGGKPGRGFTRRLHSAPPMSGRC